MDETRLPPIDAVPLVRGDMVTIDSGAEIVTAMVTLASRNGRALIVMFDGMVYNWAGQAPLFQEDNGQWKTLDQQPVMLTRVEPD